MSNAHALLAWLLLVCSAVATPAPDDAVVGAAAALRRSINLELSERAVLLDELVALADPDVAPHLLAEWSRTTRDWRDARDDAARERIQIEHLERILAQLELRKKREPALESVIERQGKRLEEARERLAGREKAYAETNQWRVLLAEAITELDGSLSKSGRRSVEKDLFEVAEEGARLEDRVAAVDWLGLTGSSGAAARLRDTMVEVVKRRREREGELREQLERVRQCEQRIQQEQERSGGNFSRALGAEYESLRRAAGLVQTEVTELGYLLEACVDAGAAALAREDEKGQKKTLTTLRRSLGKSRDGVRLRTLRMIARTPGAAPRAAVLEILADEEEPAAIGELIDELAAAGARDIAPALRERYLTHDNWHVRSRAAAALATFRDAQAIPLLIDGLDAGEGRFLSDARNALRSLTGQDFRQSAELWRRWWADAGPDFEPPVETAEGAIGDEAAEGIGTTLFGIESASQRVLYVLDVSGSMEFSMVARDNPTDDPSMAFDRPAKGEVSRLAAAKRALIGAIGGLREGAEYGLVCYASSVWSPTDGMRTMHEKERAQVYDLIDRLDANGGTNIIGAFEAAFEIVGVEDAEEWSEPIVDTIFFISDGRASIGQTTDPEEILAFVHERNRASGIVIHTIGLSGAQDAYLLRELAEQNGGVYASR